jgi:hypothetical protein
LPENEVSGTWNETLDSGKSPDVRGPTKVERIQNGEYIHGHHFCGQYRSSIPTAILNAR